MTELTAPAKLTWFLEITNRRAGGLHELRSEMTTLALADLLAVDEGGDYVRIVGPYVSALPEGDRLVRRALDLVKRRAGIVIEKQIPVGGGLGGGSADAAAILRWAGGVSAEAALSLGSDVPFCQVGGRALVTGVGEEVAHLPYEHRAVTLVLPSFSVSTALCFQAYDELRHDGWSPKERNHLEVPAGRVESRVATTLAWLRATFGLDCQLAGSGSTMFMEGFVDGEEGRRWHVTGPDGPLQLLQTTTTP